MIRGTFHGSNKLTGADPPPARGRDLPQTPLEGAGVIVLMSNPTVLQTCDAAAVVSLENQHPKFDCDSKCLSG